MSLRYFFLLSFSLITLLGFSNQKDSKVILITGGTKGIGLETAKVFSERGYSVWAAGRSVNDVMRQNYPDIHFVYLDLTNEADIESCVSEVLGTEGHIDILFNSAGYGLIGAEEAVTLKQAREQFEVNFFGTFSLTQKVLPYMRRDQKGRIINMSSTSGIRAVPGLGLYAASKFAIEALSESMAVTLSPFNIKVSVIEAGTVANNWALNCQVAENDTKVELYDNLSMQLQKKLLDLADSKGQEPREIALLIYSVASCKDPHLRYQTSKAVEKTVSHKLKDLTGDEMLVQQKSFISSILSE